MNRRLLVLFLALAPISFGAGLNAYDGSVTAQIISLVTSGEPVFLSTGTNLLTSIGVIMLGIYGLKWALQSASRHHGEFDFPSMVHWFSLFLVAEMMLRFYNAPMPFSHLSFSQFFPEAFRQFASAINLSGMNTLSTQVEAIVEALQSSSPSIWNGAEFFVYIIVSGAMISIQGILFAVTILGPVGIGLGALLGPIFIPWLAVPRMAWLFWNWLNFMIKYSFFQVVAAALVFVWTNVLVGFISNTIAGDYSLAHFLKLIVPIGLLNIGLAVSIIKIPSFLSDLFSGSMTAGGLPGAGIARGIKGLF